MLNSYHTLHKMINFHLHLNKIFNCDTFLLFFFLFVIPFYQFELFYIDLIFKWILHLALLTNDVSTCVWKRTSVINIIVCVALKYILFYKIYYILILVPIIKQSCKNPMGYRSSIKYYVYKGVEQY